MKEYIITVFSVITLLSLVVSVLPKGKSSKSAKTAFAGLCISVMIMPITAIINGDFDFSAIFDRAVQTDCVIDEIYYEYCKSLSEIKIKNNVQKLLKNIGITDSVISINYSDKTETFEIAGIKVSLKSVPLSVEAEKSLIKDISQLILIEEKNVEINYER